MVSKTWNNIALDDSNKMVRFKKKLQILKKEIRAWGNDYKKKQSCRLMDLRSKLCDIDKVLDQGGVNDDILLSRLDVLKNLHDIKSSDTRDYMQKLSYFLHLPQIWLLILMRIGLVVPPLGDRLQEYHGVANAVAETYWLMNLLRELHTLLSSAMLVYYDNVSAIYLSCNLVQHQRTKYIEIDIHFVCDLVATSQIVSSGLKSLKMMSHVS
nr:ribonuclease H-like domain-containing protein [Tanacetum cinerariifolium]